MVAQRACRPFIVIIEKRAQALFADLSVHGDPVLTPVSMGRLGRAFDHSSQPSRRLHDTPSQCLSARRHLDVVVQELRREGRRRSATRGSRHSGIDDGTAGRIPGPSAAETPRPRTTGAEIDLAGRAITESQPHDVIANVPGFLDKVVHRPTPAARCAATGAVTGNEPRALSRPAVSAYCASADSNATTPRRCHRRRHAVKQRAQHSALT